MGGKQQESDTNQTDGRKSLSSSNLCMFALIGLLLKDSHNPFKQNENQSHH